MIPEATIEEVRGRIDPVEAIGRRIELKKAGASFLAACPFHSDGTPSFRVFPDSKRFKCFGCGARGDVIEFLCRFEKKGFRTVVQELAAEAGVPLEEGGKGTGKPDDGGASRILARACEAALVHWSDRLWGDPGAEARKYLQARGVSEATAHQYRLGYALPEWHDLGSALKGKGFLEEDLLRAGLLARNANGRSAHDRFRGRVVFPYLRGSREVVGFGARLLTAGGDGAEHPKYLNSPETPLFRKGQLLFGLSEARAAIRIARRAVLVEGYVDALALAQAGLREVVASAGTAVTPAQLALLQRAGAEELVVAFDTDQAGLAAPARLAPVLLAGGASTRIARLPGSATDPDAFVRAHGLRGLEGVLGFATPLTEWLLERAVAGRLAGAASRALSVEQKLLIVRDLAPYVAASRPGLPRALFEQRIARRLELYIVALRAELARLREGRARRGQPDGAAAGIA